MLKTIGSTRSTANLQKTKSEVDGNIMVGDSMIGSGKATNQANSTKKKIRWKQLNPKFW